MVDFLNFESQATQWLPGSRPEFDFATSFKVSVDDLFLRYLATEELVIEVCEAQQADYELVAKCCIPLAPLLDSRPTLVLKKQPLTATRSGKDAGFAHVEIRLALPVTELYQLFLDRHPLERTAIEKAMLKQLTKGTDTVFEDEDGTTQRMDATLAAQSETGSISSVARGVRAGVYGSKVRVLDTHSHRRRVFSRERESICVRIFFFFFFLKSSK